MRETTEELQAAFPDGGGEAACEAAFQLAFQIL